MLAYKILNLIGNFQNVSKDYFKTNLYGIRECCQSNLLGTYDSSGNFVPADNTNQVLVLVVVSSSCDTQLTLYQSYQLKIKQIFIILINKIQQCEFT
jgi:hypothetical protein